MNEKVYIRFGLLTILVILPYLLYADSIEELRAKLALATDNEKTELAIDIGVLMSKTSRDSALKYFKIAENIAVASETREDDIKLCRAYGYFHTHFSNDFTESKKHYLKALKMSELNGDRLTQALTYNDLGIVGWKQGHYLPAIENYYKADKFVSELNDPNLEMRVCLSLGIVHNESALNDKAKKLYARALKLAEQIGNESSIGMLLNNLGKVHRDLEEYDKSLEYFHRADSLFKAHEDTHWQCYAVYNLGYTHLAEGNLEDAKKYLNKAKEMNANFDNVFMDLMIDSEIAKIYEEQKSYTEALALASQMLKTSDKLDTEIFYIKIFPILANSYEKLGKPELAVEYFRKSNEAAMKMNTAEQQNELNKRNALIKFRQKELEVKQLEIEVERENTQFQKVVSYLFVSIVILFLLLAGGAMFFYKMELNQLKKYEELRTKLTYDLHDNVGSSLNQIKMLVARLRPGRNQEELMKKQAEVSKIKSLSNDLIINMQDLVWSIDPENDSLDNLIDKMRDHASNVFTPIDMPYRMKVTGELKNILLDPKVKSNLYSLFKEAINNIVKHTQSEQTQININYNKNTLRICIENGKEIVLDSEYSSKKGLKSMKLRAEEMGGILKLDDLPDKFVVDLKLVL